MQYKVRRSRPVSNGMDLKNFIQKDALHHAYIMYGQHESVFDKLTSFLEEIDFSLHGNPDFYSVNQEVLSIDTVRGIVESSSRKAINGKKIYVIKSRILTREAQNALLKILEEPGEDTHFFILLQGRGSVLPTLLSRAQEISLENEDSIHADVTDFINSSLNGRLKIAEEISKEKDRQRASNLISGILRERDRIALSESSLKALEIGLRYIDLPSSSVKMLLENIALKFEKK